jgi:hypothetical protein
MVQGKFYMAERRRKNITYFHQCAFNRRDAHINVPDSSGTGCRIYLSDHAFFSDGKRLGI